MNSAIAAHAPEPRPHAKPVGAVLTANALPQDKRIAAKAPPTQRHRSAALVGTVLTAKLFLSASQENRP
ncbi:hypothetical protein FBY03_13234 [Pseudomonas sp. SJZ079]|nr:hypothetical protein FBY03_13234 [Pseudomonas sp. SJZ079]